MSAEEGVVASYQFDVLVDHNQIFLEDRENEWEDDDPDALYDEAAFARHLGVTTSCLSIFTARWYGVVRLEVVVCAMPPSDDLTEWDNVAEASIEVQSGCLVAFGPESYEHGSRIPVQPATYRVRVYAGDIGTVDEYMANGHDHYRVVLWPAPYQPPALLHVGDGNRW